MIHLPDRPSQETIDFESYQNRRQFLSAAGIGIASASAASLLSTHPASSAESGTIRPFRVNFPEADLVDLRRRVKATKWPDRETVKDPSQGVQLATMRELARYWATEHDWRKIEAKLNALPQFITEIDGLDIHFIHVRSKHENALPMIVTHGWPGSIIEQLKIIDPLTNPTAHGGSASDAFDLVIPSLPGHGFSGKPTCARVDPRQHCTCVGDVDATPRLHTVRGAGRGLGQRRLGSDGAAAAAGIARHSHQYGGHGSTRCFKSSFGWRAASRRLLGR